MNASYRRLDEKETHKLGTEKDCRGILDNARPMIDARTTDLSVGGMSLLSRENFQVGEFLVVVVDLPKIGGGFDVLVEVRWVDTYENADGTTHRAGLKMIYARPYDMARLTNYLRFWGKI
jgi:hypothetical protein